MQIIFFANPSMVRGRKASISLWRISVAKLHSFWVTSFQSVVVSWQTYSCRPTWNLRQFTFSRTHFSTAFLQFLHLFFLLSPHLFSKHSSANLRFFPQTLLSNLNVRHVSLQPSRFPHLPLPREKKDFPPGEGWCPGYV